MLSGRTYRSRAAGSCVGLKRIKSRNDRRRGAPSPGDGSLGVMGPEVEYRVQDGDATGPNEPAEASANAPVTPVPPAGNSSARVWVRREASDFPAEGGFEPGDLTDVENEWDRLEDLPGAEVIKSNLSRQVISLPATDRRPSLIIKRYRVRGRSERLKYLFLPSRAAREWRALLELESAGFPTPRPLAMFEEKDGRWLRGAGLVMERLEEVFPAPDLVFADPSGEPARDELLRSCGRIVARLHRKGIAHPDLHLGNFLANPDDSSDVRLVDLHAVHHKSVVGSPRRRSDLAKLIHSLGADIDRHSVRQVLLAYLEECASADGSFLGALEEEIDLVGTEARDLERIRLKSRDRRCWGTTSQFIAESKDAWRIHRRREFSPESLAPLLDGSWSAVRTLREGRGEQVCEVELPTGSGTVTAIVHTLERGFFAGLFDRLVRSPLERAWGAARRFEVRGLPHARGEALLVERRGGRIARTILVTEKRSGISLAAAILERSSDPRAREIFARRAIDTIAPLLRQLHRAGIHHRDTSPENWLVESVEPVGSSILLGDLSEVHPSQRPSLARRRENLLQLALLPEGGATRIERFRFLVRYHRGERMFPAWLRDLDAAFGERQVAAIEERIARERAHGLGTESRASSEASSMEPISKDSVSKERASIDSPSSSPEEHSPAPDLERGRSETPKSAPPTARSVRSGRASLSPNAAPLGVSSEPSATNPKDGDDR